MSGPVIHLASKSPRRAELLRQIGVAFEPLRVNVPEEVIPGESPEAFVQRLAREKAQAGLIADSRRDELPVLGADTAVVVDEDVLGKPRNRADALAMLARLSGRRHLVLSAVTVANDARIESALSETSVWFREITEAEAVAYWDTGEPADKAGAYGIQGFGAIFVERIDGSYSGVMGLPVYETARLLEWFDIKAGRR